MRKVKKVWKRGYVKSFNNFLHFKNSQSELKMTFNRFDEYFKGIFK